ncbi:hypothetical protein CACET_c31030 [Clostridium aceticum]|uniref:Uncharacterized protein n=1 Tax=Clostridium aceticum TaxID=84022 RepID=A0A0G3WF47_9CLOT|nr:hypothetical protein CACET_c31030 [Clostridium aceticum]
MMEHFSDDYDNDWDTVYILRKNQKIVKFSRENNKPYTMQGKKA